VRRAALLVVATLCASACATPRAPVPLAPTDPRPARFLSQWSETVLSRHALRGRAHLVIDGDVRARGNQIVVLERPARMRVEVLGLFNQTAAVIATDGEQFEVLHTDDRSYYAGAAAPDLLWREAHLALTPRETVELLLGGPPVDPALSPVRAVSNVGDDGDGEWVRMDLVDADQRVRRRIAFDSEAQLRQLEVLEMDGSVRWRATFGDFSAVAGAPFAHSIVLDVTAGSAHVEISLRDVELNPELPPGVFRIREPAEATVAPGAAGDVHGSEIAWRRSARVARSREGTAG